jgi:putative transposase
VRAAKRCLSRLISCWGEPGGIVTGILRSYSAALRKLGLNVDHGAHKGLNNRIESSQRPTRKREKIQGRLKPANQAQRFLSALDVTANLFHPRRHNVTASGCRQNLAAATERWNGCANCMVAR